MSGSRCRIDGDDEVGERSVPGLEGPVAAAEVEHPAMDDSALFGQPQAGPRTGEQATSVPRIGQRNAIDHPHGPGPPPHRMSGQQFTGDQAGEHHQRGVERGDQQSQQEQTGVRRTDRVGEPDHGRGHRVEAGRVVGNPDGVVRLVADPAVLQILPEGCPLRAPKGYRWSAARHPPTRRHRTGAGPRHPRVPAPNSWRTASRRRSSRGRPTTGRVVGVDSPRGNGNRLCEVWGKRGRQAVSGLGVPALRSSDVRSGYGSVGVRPV